MNAAPDSSRPRRIMWGRIISLAGALGLSVSFFLEQVANLPAPSEIMVAPMDLEISMILPPFLAAALLLPLMAFQLVPQIGASRNARRSLAWTRFAISLTMLVAGLAALIYTLWMTSGSVPLAVYSLPVLGFLAMVLAVISLVRSRLARKAAAVEFALWAYHSVFFTIVGILRMDSVAPGLWVSLAACGLLVIGSSIDWFQCHPAKETRR